MPSTDSFVKKKLEGLPPDLREQAEAKLREEMDAVQGLLDEKDPKKLVAHVRGLLNKASDLLDPESMKGKK